MTLIYLLLLLVAAVCFALCVFNVPVGRINVLALGFLAWVLVPFLQALTRL